MFDSRDYKKPVTSPPYGTPVQSRSPAQRERQAKRAKNQRSRQWWNHR